MDKPDLIFLCLSCQCIWQFLTHNEEQGRESRLANWSFIHNMGYQWWIQDFPQLGTNPWRKSNIIFDHFFRNENEEIASAMSLTPTGSVGHLGPSCALSSLSYFVTISPEVHPSHTCVYVIHSHGRLCCHGDLCSLASVEQASSWRLTSEFIRDQIQCHGVVIKQGSPNEYC